ncbi:MAG TPA: Uma2 family endonuclease [Blastocatellia bacterium]|nr:Uma2 family endonuclease [Blastocatellia bacterium]
MATTLEEQTTPAALPALPARKVSFEEYLAWAQAQESAYEWVDGEIIPMAAATLSHQELIGFLVHILRSFARHHQLGRIIFAPYPMKLETQRRGREPDIMFVTREREHLLTPTFLNGPADVAVEIISRESIGRDRGDKYVEYEAAGVREYWLLDPERQQAEFYRLTEAGHYRQALPDADNIFRSAVITGFWLRVEWLWELPDELEVLRELGVR